MFLTLTADHLHHTERLQSGKAKKTLVPKCGVQSISKAASWKSSKKDLLDIHLKYVIKNCQSREQTSSILVQSVANTEIAQDLCNLGKRN